MNGDELSIAINLQRSVENYTWESYIYRSDTSTMGGGAGALSGIGATVTQPTVGISNSTTGALVIGLSEAQTHALSVGTSYRWYLRWKTPTDIARTIVSGSVTVVAP